MLYTNATIITVNATRDIISDGALLVSHDTIADIGQTTDLTSKYPHEATTALAGRIIIPGLINTHMHTAQTLLRGAPTTSRSIAEMLKSGTTTFLESMFADRYGFEGLCRAVAESGIRGCLGKVVMDGGAYAGEAGWAMHAGLVEDREVSLGGAVGMFERWEGEAEGRIRVWFGARTPGGVSEALYKEMAAISREKQIPITMHCAEVPADRAFFASRGHTPMSYCSSVGLLGPQTVLVHMVHLDSSDIATLADTGTHVVHCPSSNTKLASGICDVPGLLSAGVNVTLGTDGAPCNNTCDLLQEMRLAGILHKVATMDPTAVPAETVLEMATVNGAKALGLASQIGSLEVGKKADFVVLDMRALHVQPWFNPVSAVVYTASGRDVEVVVVDGKVVVEGGRLLRVDEEGVWREAAVRARQVVERAGLGREVGARWRVV
ncbi:guanine deaminase [Teratosphaeria destructans]|uniref:Guanine deaminase n=1 Tax=Teratosphaeria destructans TaxID=418781 RepID=A0A9W7W351_9PEZI|nr:guanine deaminase [Teratosphaeria destructans]